MKNKIVALSIVLFVFVCLGSQLPAWAQQDNSPTAPASIGTPVRSMIELGSVAANIYDITVTNLEVIRGQEALSRMKSADAANPTPPAGFEYVLARVRYELRGRSVSDTLSLEVGRHPMEWLALAADFSEYEKPAMTAPSPALVGRLEAGKSLEGWVAFIVDAKDARPIMVYDPDVGAATGRGRTLFFRLY
jgi:hypothetical protein